MGEILGPLWLGAEIIAIAAGIGAGCEMAIKPKPREAVRRLIQPLAKVDLWQIADSFIQFFDCLFEPSSTGRPRIWRSVLASCFALTITSLYWWHHYPERVRTTIELLMNSGNDWLIPFSARVGVVFVASSAVTINIIGDIFSMWETRWVLGRLANTKSAVRTFALVIADIIASFFIYLLGAFVSFGLFEVMLGGSASAYLFVVRYFLLHILDFNNLLFRSYGTVEMDIFVVFLYTSMITSVWIWLFVIGIKTISLVQVTLRSFARLFDLDKRPVAFVMLTGGVVLGVLSVSVGWMGVLTESWR